jgi:hypothetical protein
MKSTKLTSVLATLSLVLFMSVASIANSGQSNTGDLSRSGNQNLAVLSTSDKDFSYLHFDVNHFIYENESEAVELPVANEFEYLRFDVNNYTGINSDALTELPRNEYDYLRFDTSDFTSSANSVIDELPVTE